MDVSLSIQSSLLKCNRCPLRQDNQVVDFDFGTPKSKVMLLFESPNDCDKHPKFKKTISNICGGVSISSVVLCTLPQNRAPQYYECYACKDNLLQVIQAMYPQIIVTIGSLSAQWLVPGIKITQKHGQIIKSNEFNVDIFPIYNPSYVIGYSYLDRRKDFKKDLQKLANITKERVII